MNESNRVTVFIVVFAIIGIIINHIGSQQSDSETASTPPMARPMNPAFTPNAQPAQNVQPRRWPDDVPATHVIHVPDPGYPVAGNLDNTLRPGEELEMDFDPLWIFDNSVLPAGIEMAIKSEGEHFESVNDYLRDHTGNGWWGDHRVARFHLRPGFNTTTFRILVINE